MLHVLIVCVVVVFKAYGVKRDFINRRLRRQRTTIEEGDDSYSYSFSAFSPTWQLLDELRHVCGVGLEKNAANCVFFVQEIVRNRNQRKTENGKRKRTNTNKSFPVSVKTAREYAT